MSRTMIIVGSVRPGRIGLSIARWVQERAEAAGLDVDFADLAEINLPFLDEPSVPELNLPQEKDHSRAWSERVKKASSVILISPEYNHGYSPALKNALDYLFFEWQRKHVAIVSYGGLSGGTRAASALESVLAFLGMIRTLENAALPHAGQRVVDGRFEANERDEKQLAPVLAELVAGLN